MGHGLTHPLKPPSAAREEAADDQEARATGDRHIGHVEGRPVPARPMRVEEVGDRAFAIAIECIAQGPAGDQRQADPFARDRRAQGPDDQTG